jgi:hypothetical protein
MARKVRQIRRKGKDIGIVPVPATTAPDWSTRMALIQALIPVGCTSRSARNWYSSISRLAASHNGKG